MSTRKKYISEGDVVDGTGEDEMGGTSQEPEEHAFKNVSHNAITTKKKKKSHEYHRATHQNVLLWNQDTPVS